MQNQMDELIQKDPSYVRLHEDIAGNRFFHAQLLANRDGEYLFGFVLRLIQSVLNHLGQTALAQKAARGALLDLTVLAPEKSIKVEDLEPVLEKVSQHGIECDQKFFVIKDAHKMTIEAQNKLLKTLEEPNADVYFFLCAPSRFLLLPTIVSRCNVTEPATQKKSTIEEWLVSCGASVPNAKVATELSLGSASLAQQYLEKPSPSFELALSGLVGVLNSGNALTYAAKFQKCNLPEVLDYMEFLVLDALKIKFHAGGVWFSSIKSKLLPLSMVSFKGLLFIYQKIQEIKSLLPVNVSSTMLSDKLALAIAEGKHQ